jgi:SanA protein
MADRRSSHRNRKPRSSVRRWLGHLAFATITGIVLVAAANAYVVYSTKGGIVSRTDDAPTVPAAIVLGTRVNVDGSPASGLAERLELALELYRAGRARRLILSGANWGNGYDEPGVMAHWLTAHGVPEADLTLDRRGHRTAATMANASAMGFKQALVCTQPYHLPRALYLARHAGIDAVGVPARDDADGYETVRYLLRESLARAQALIEVTVLGVQAQ